MASCRACTVPLDADDRYCSRCGAAVADDIEVLHVDDAVTEPLRISRTGPRTVLVAAVGGLAALLVLSWALSSGSSDEDTASPPDSTPAPGDEAGERTPRLGRPDGESGDRQDTLPRRENESDEGGGDRGQGTGTTGGETDSDGAGASPVLGRSVGWSLWYGRSGRLRKLDLDTGEVTDYELRGTPVHASGGRLVVRTSDFAALKSVPVDDPDGDDLVELPPAANNIVISPIRGEVPGTAWLVGGPFGDPRLQLVRLADGAVLGELERAPLFFWLAGGAPLVISTPDGSLFEQDGDSFRYVADGSLVAAGDDHVLVTRCTSPDGCRLQWLGRPSFETILRPLPDGSNFVGGWLSPGGRVLMLNQWGPTVVFDVERDTELELDVGFVSPEAFAVSPDERYVATAEGPVRIHDLDTGEVIEVEVGFNEGVVFSTDG